MIAAILPLLYVERGAQMTFVLQSCLLLVSGVYYSVDVLPGWMQVLSRLSPATYVLDGVRHGLIDGAPIGALVHDVWPLLVMGVGPHPVRPVGVRPRRALRQADRQAQEGRLMTTARPRPRSAGPARSRPPFAAHAAAGLEPARVVAEDRGSYVVQTAGGERRASVTGRYRFEAGDDPAAYPAVGDWVAVEARADGASVHARPAAPDERRSATRRASDRSPRSSPRTSTSCSSSRRSTTTSTCAASSATSRFAWESGAEPVVRPLEGRPRRRPRRPRMAEVETVAVGVDDHRRQRDRRPRDRRAPRPHRRRARPSRSSARRASASRRSSTRSPATSWRRSARSARTTPAAATRRPAASST